MRQAYKPVTAQKDSLIALGSNLGVELSVSFKTIKRAIEAIDHLLDVTSIASKFYRTPSFPAGSGPDFVNACVRISSPLEPSELLEKLHQIEAGFGRVRNKRWDARTLDLDLVACGETVSPNVATLKHWMGLPLSEQMEKAPEQLILPHPRLQDRAFVLVPLADIAPNWVHPVLGKTVVEMRDALPKKDIDDVVPYENETN